MLSTSPNLAKSHYTSKSVDMIRGHSMVLERRARGNLHAVTYGGKILLHE
jgi:hypothetical protein